jgi:hypothetical protein
MPQRLSSILKVSAELLDKKGIFNSFADVDSKLYIDPSLLENCKIKEFKQSYKTFKIYFTEILKLIETSKLEGDVFWRTAHKRLQFKEFKPVALGYSLGNKNGNAIGSVLAMKILLTANEIVAVGINDPIIFELVGIFEKNIGADRISDMTIQIIKSDLISFTQRVSEELGIEMREYGTSRILLPFNPKSKEPIVFTPKTLLRDLPIALCWDDISSVCGINESIRKDVNTRVGRAWKKATTSKPTKPDLKNALLSNPDALRNLIEQYKGKPRSAYNFETDPSGQVIWAELSEKAALQFPINFQTLNLKPVTNENILNVVKTICNQYAKLIESNGWFEFLYNDLGKLRNERFAQKLFYGIADQYCLANDLNLSREPNAGSGALDFKITKGYKTVVTIEIKYSSNTNLIKGYTKQLPTYNKSENADSSIYLVLRTTESDNLIKSLLEQMRLLKVSNPRAPDVIVVDARQQKSASLRR